MAWCGIAEDSAAREVLRTAALAAGSTVRTAEQAGRWGRRGVPVPFTCVSGETAGG